MKSNLFRTLLLFLMAFAVSPTPAFSQEPTGGGSLIRDITGGAAIIFRAPKDPVVHAGDTTQGNLGGGKIKDPRKPKEAAPQPARKQDPILARANAARSASKPRYAEAEEQYRLAAAIAPDDARAFAGLGNVFVDQGRFAEAVTSYQQALKVRSDYN